MGANVMTTTPQAALLSAPNPLLKRCYTMSEPHLSGYRVVIGFERMEDAQDAHEYIAKLQATQEPVQAGELPDERAAFEAEMRCSEEWGHRSLKKRTNGKYENWQVDLMWDVWQARAALSARKPAVPMTPESIHMIGEQLADCCYGPAGGPMECYQFEPGALVEFVRAIEGYGIGLEVKPSTTAGEQP